MEQLFGHFDLIKILLTIVAFFLVRTLNKVDKNQGLLFGRLEQLERRFNRLYGAHEVNHGVRRRNDGDDE